MHCGGTWSNEFLFQSIPYTSWTEGMKKRRAEWLLGREKSLLVNTQGALEYFERAQSIREEAEKVRALRNKLNNQLRTLREEIDRLDALGHVLLNPNDHQVGNHGLLRYGKVSTSLIPCPENDCRGFVVDGECSLCHSRICPLCHCASHGDHPCEFEALLTMRKLKKSTKRCPLCSALSEKVNGCSEVFCWSCKRSWDWKTAKPTEPREELHTYDYRVCDKMQDCDGLETHFKPQHCPRSLARRFQQATEGGIPSPTDSEHQQLLRSTVSSCMLTFVELRDDLVTPPGPPKQGELRIQYLKKQIDESEWKEALLKEDMESALNKKILEWQRVCFGGMCDFMMDVVDRGERVYPFDFAKLQSCFLEFAKFVRMMQREYDEILSRFGTTEWNPLDMLEMLMTNISARLAVEGPSKFN